MQICQNFLLSKNENFFHLMRSLHRVVFPILGCFPAEKARCDRIVLNRFDINHIHQKWK